jgi:signal transduction histidine kinase
VTRLWPRSLAGQMALLVALGLFLAQAVNFALLLAERRAARLAYVTGPAVARLIDAAESGAPPDQSEPPRGRVRRVAANPIDARLPRVPEVERAVSAGLTDAGSPPRATVAAIRPVERDQAFRRRESERRRAGLPVSRHEVVIAVQQPRGDWLTLRARWDQGGSDWLVWRLAIQTLVLYVAVLVPLLWVGRRIATPLRDLARAAEDFAPGRAPVVVAERGPDDVARLIAAVNALGQRVTAMLDEKDRMLGAIGHDLRTPLAALRVRIESVEDDADRQRMADTIEEMNRTLDDILSLARLGRPSEPATEVDLSALVDAVVEDFRDLGHDVALEDGRRLPMRLRPSLTRRAVRNLIENAVKYAGAAEVRIAEEPHAIRVVVADRGPGIPPDRLEDVFDPFTRLETSRNRDTGGIGLGLALARAIVREARGDITLAARPGGGLEATIRLPR